MKASSKARLAAEASRITADVDGHGQIELGQPSSRVTLDRSSAVHRQTTQLVDPEHRYTVPRVQVDADVASVCTTGCNRLLHPSGPTGAGNNVFYFTAGRWEFFY